MAKKRKPHSSNTATRRRKLIKGLLVVAALALAGYLVYLNYLIGLRFEGDTWALPSRVYARPLDLYPGLELNRESLQYELSLSTYERVKTQPLPGQYRVLGNSIEIHSRSFVFSDQTQPMRQIRVDFSGDEVTRILDMASSRPLELFRLPPVVIGSYYPQNEEDRLLLTADEIPQSLIDILLTVEDKRFYQHLGINPPSIFRALIANLKAGKAVQGGSTLTQQLAKNLFLTPERSFVRKINEAFMAMLLEIRFSKQTILAAYINEVFLLQQNRIAIHGFALASHLLFEQSLDRLSTDKLALLVGMVKGPSWYNPITQPQAALERRNLVLGILFENGLLDDKAYQYFRNQPLEVIARLPGVNRFPAYLDLVKRQLKNNYSAAELSARGLRIFTPFDPLIQRNLEQGLESALARFDQPELQASVVIADYLNGDLQALVGGRQVDFPGFNRAIMAQRPIGSLIKPLLLYSLLEGNMTLASKVEDKPVQIRQSDGKIWEPRNYDRQLHGEMSLYQAFVNSYNLPFVRLGINGGLEALAKNLERINLLKHDVIYPSLLLGTTSMSTFEVAQMFQVIANNGYFTPLTTIRQVSDQHNNTLSRIPLASHKLFDQAYMIQVQRALIGVSEEGTAKYLKNRFGDYTLAGKTGTTNDARDSWFSGFSRRLLTVVWLGNDDNTPINLSGSSGALRVWAEIMQRQKIYPFKLTRDASLEWHSIDRFDGGLTRQNCANSVLLPFVAGKVPVKRSRCE
ncbi:MAG: penicillin-binding protein 1B [Gammaproteobacteria bacterium]